MGTDAVPGSGLKHQQQCIAADVRVRGVGLLGLEAELRRVVAGLEHQVQRALEAGIDIRLPGQAIDWLPGLKDPGFLEAGPGDVANVVARQVCRAVSGKERGHHDKEDHAPQRTRTSATRGTSVGERAVLSGAVTDRSTGAAPGSCTTRMWRPDPARSTPLWR